MFYHEVLNSFMIESPLVKTLISKPFEVFGSITYSI